jgi:hypothetical protein
LARAIAVGRRSDGTGIDLGGAEKTAGLVQQMISAGRSA